MKHYEPFTYTVTLKEHQTIEPGEILEGDGSRLKVLAIQSVQEMNRTTMIGLTVRELPGIDPI